MQTTLEKPLQQIALDFVNSRTEKSFTLLYNRLRPGLKKFVQRYHSDHEIVEEILAISLSKAYIYVDKYDSQWNFSTWIYKICQNECLMELRRQKNILSLETMLESKAKIKAINDSDWKYEEDYEPFKNQEEIQPESLYEDVLNEIRNLPDHYKKIIEDRIVLKMKYKDIAEKRDMKINTVRSRIHSAKKVIKHLWIEKKKNEGGKKLNRTINILGVAMINLLDKKEETKKLDLENISITSASYGAGEIWINVTEKFSQLFFAKGEAKVSNRLGGDPCYGSAKVMKLEYVKDDKNISSELKEGTMFKP